MKLVEQLLQENLRFTQELQGWIERNNWHGSARAAEIAIQDARSLTPETPDMPAVDPLGTREDFERDVAEAEQVYAENPSSKNAYDLYAAKEAVRRRWPNGRV